MLYSTLPSILLVQSSSCLISTDCPICSEPILHSKLMTPPQALLAYSQDNLCFRFDGQPPNPWPQYSRISVASCCSEPPCCLERRATALPIWLFAENLNPPFNYFDRLPAKSIQCVGSSCLNKDLGRVHQAFRLALRHLLRHVQHPRWHTRQLPYGLVIHISSVYCRRPRSGCPRVPHWIWVGCFHQACCFEGFPVGFLAYSGHEGQQPLVRGHWRPLAPTDWDLPML